MSSITSLSAQFTLILDEIASGEAGSIEEVFDEITTDGDPKVNY
jgi:hypothetical protein